MTDLYDDLARCEGRRAFTGKPMAQCIFCSRRLSESKEVLKPALLQGIDGGGHVWHTCENRVDSRAVEP